jgi:hypothetical protein
VDRPHDVGQTRSDPVSKRRSGRGARSSGLVARWAGGVAALVLLGASMTGLGLGAYVARTHDRARSSVTTELRSSLGLRLEAQLALIERETKADDWSHLQAALPERAAGDPEIILLAVTDGEGLVLAASSPADDGYPLRDAMLRSQLAAPSSVPKPIELAGRPALLLTSRLANERIAWVAISTQTLSAASAALRVDARAAIVQGWWVVGLGGFVCMVIGIGVVLIVGGTLARDLRVVAWRISELGRGDRSTHVRLEGPAELEHVGQELERAAERLAVAEERAVAQAPIAQERAALDALHAYLLPEQITVGDVTVTRSGTLPPHACALAVRHAGPHTLVALIEVVGERIEDALLAAELRALVLTSRAIGPAQLLAELEPHVGTQRARVVALAVGADAQIANAGGAFVGHRVGEAVRTIVVRGDRLGEPSPQRDAAVTVSLSQGEALLLADERDGLRFAVERVPSATSDLPP